MNEYLTFQRVQKTLTQGISSLAFLADKLAKDVPSNQTPNMTEIMHDVMDSLVLVTHANWSLNMKRRELIKRDLNPPFTRLCKPEITPTTKLFKNDLQRHLKEMTDVSRVGKQQLAEWVSSCQAFFCKKASQMRTHPLKPYDRPRQNYGYKNQNKKPFKCMAEQHPNQGVAQEKQQERQLTTHVGENSRSNLRVPAKNKLQCQDFTAGQVKNHFPTGN